MSGGVCPWWLGYILILPLRRFWQDPHSILLPHVKAGMSVLEPGAGMGYFTLELARLVGPQGHVFVADIQPRMLRKLAQRAARAGLTDRIELILSDEVSCVTGTLTSKVDFVFAFAVVHEMPSATRFFYEMSERLRPGGKLLLAEPRGHVSKTAWEAEVDSAVRAGFRLELSPQISRSRAAVFILAEAVK